VYTPTNHLLLSPLPLSKMLKKLSI
jgi:hypothetical protein